MNGILLPGTIPTHLVMGFAFDPNFDEFGDYTQRAIETVSILDDSSSTWTPYPTLMTNQHAF